MRSRPADLKPEHVNPVPRTRLVAGFVVIAAIAGFAVASCGGGAHARGASRTGSSGSSRPSQTRGFTRDRACPTALAGGPRAGEAVLRVTRLRLAEIFHGIDVRR